MLEWGVWGLGAGEMTTMVQRMRPVAAGTAPVAPMKVEDVVGLSPNADVGTGRPDPGHVLQIHPTEVGDVLTRVSMGPESAHAWVLEATMPRCAYILDVEASRARDLHNLDMKTIGPRNTHMDLVGTGAALALNLEQPEAGDQCGPGMCPERGVAPIEPREFEQNHSHLQKEPGGGRGSSYPGYGAWVACRSSRPGYKSWVGGRVAVSGCKLKSRGVSGSSYRGCSSCDIGCVGDMELKCDICRGWALPASTAGRT